jgi:O-acetyl-ADP-ribose deacetylase (regulator of RNase III)
MSNLNIIILVTGFVCLAIGLGLYFANTRKKVDRQNFYTANIISWILIALFPALVIFSLFPEDQMKGSLFGFSMTGAAALFVFIWWRGVGISQKAVQLDELNNKIRALEEELQKSRNLQAPGADAPSFKPLPTEFTSYPLIAKHKRKIGLITGNLQGVKGVDIWVNSENTNMQMSRFYDRSISGAIRHLGACKDKFGAVAEDLIVKELTGVMGDKGEVAPGTVLITESGALKESHGVKKIFHAASVRGEAASGYRVIDNIGSCVTNALNLADTELSGEPCKTILFPLLGAGAGKARPEDVAGPLMMAAIEYLESQTDTSIDTVYFLAWGERELEVCKSALASTGRVTM